MNIINYSIENEMLGSRQLLLASYRSPSVSGLLKQSIKIESIAKTDCFTRKLPSILKERTNNISDSRINKIFCAQWLDERNVLMGTKCNKVKKINIFNRCKICQYYVYITIAGNT